MGVTESPKGQRLPLCPKCQRPVDRLQHNAQRDPATRKWEHKECRDTPRWTNRFRDGH